MKIFNLELNFVTKFIEFLDAFDADKERLKVDRLLFIF